MSTLVNPKYRHELKFEMNRLSAELLMRKLSTIMEYDEHSNPKDGSYVISRWSKRKKKIQDSVL